MKKLYIFFVLAGLLATQQTQTMLRQAGSQLGRAGVRTFRTTPLNTGSLVRGGNLGLINRGITTGGQSGRSSLLQQSQPSLWRPQMSQTLRGYQQSLSNQMNQLAHAVRTNPYFRRAALAGLGLGGGVAGYNMLGQPVLAEEGPNLDAIAYSAYRKLDTAFPVITTTVPVNMLKFKNSSLTEEENKAVVQKLFAKLYNFYGYQPDGAFLTAVSNIDNESFSVLESLIKEGLISPGHLFAEGHTGIFDPSKTNIDRIMPLIKKVAEETYKNGLMPKYNPFKWKYANKGALSFNDTIEQELIRLKENDPFNPRINQYEEILLYTNPYPSLRDIF